MTAYSSPKGISSDKEESFFERWLLMPKILYFMLNMLVYAFHGVMGPLFLDTWHFPAYMYAYATMIVTTNFVGSMVWSSLADRTGRYKLIILSTATIYTIISVYLSTYYKAPKNPEFFDYCIVFAGYGLWNFFLSAAFPLLDAQIMGKLAKNPKLSKDQFGAQRMYGAFGHFFATLVSFLVLGSATGTLIFNVLTFVGFFLAVFFGVDDLKVAKGGHHHHASSDNKGKEGVSAPPKSPVMALMTNPSFVFFMLFVAAMGTVRSVSSNFQKLITLSITEVDIKAPPTTALGKWLVEKGLNRKLESKFYTAIVDFGRMLSEIFVYIYAKSMKDAVGVYWILVLSQLTGIARMYGYGLLPRTSPYSYYGIWALELIKGFSSGLVSCSAIPIASNIAPPGCESTAQGLYSGNYAGLSNAFAGGVSGLILGAMYVKDDKEKEKNDIQSMFCWVTLGTLVITFAMAAKFIFIDRVMGIPGFPRRVSGAH